MVNLPVTPREQPIKKRRDPEACPYHTVRMQPPMCKAECLDVGGKEKADRGDGRDMLMGGEARRAGSGVLRKDADLWHLGVRNQKSKRKDVSAPFGLRVGLRD